MLRLRPDQTFPPAQQNPDPDPDPHIHVGPAIMAVHAHGCCFFSAPCARRAGHMAAQSHSCGTIPRYCDPSASASPLRSERKARAGNRRELSHRTVRSRRATGGPVPPPAPTAAPTAAAAAGLPGGARTLLMVMAASALQPGSAQFVYDPSHLLDPASSFWPLVDDQSSVSHIESGVLHRGIYRVYQGSPSKRARTSRPAQGKGQGNAQAEVPSPTNPPQPFCSSCRFPSPFLQSLQASSQPSPLQQAGFYSSSSNELHHRPPCSPQQPCRKPTPQREQRPTPRPRDQDDRYQYQQVQPRPRQGYETAQASDHSAAQDNKRGDMDWYSQIYNVRQPSSPTSSYPTPAYSPSYSFTSFSSSSSSLKNIGKGSPTRPRDCPAEGEVVFYAGTPYECSHGLAFRCATRELTFSCSMGCERKSKAVQRQKSAPIARLTEAMVITKSTFIGGQNAICKPWRQLQWRIYFAKTVRLRVLYPTYCLIQLTVTVNTSFHSRRLSPGLLFKLLSHPVKVVATEILLLRPSKNTI
eukprot:g67959.t1